MMMMMMSSASQVKHRAPWDPPLTPLLVYHLLEEDSRVSSASTAVLSSPNARKVNSLSRPCLLDWAPLSLVEGKKTTQACGNPEVLFVSRTPSGSMNTHLLFKIHQELDNKKLDPLLYCDLYHFMSCFFHYMFWNDYDRVTETRTGLLTVDTYWLFNTQCQFLTSNQMMFGPSSDSKLLTVCTWELRQFVVRTLLGDLLCVTVSDTDWWLSGSTLFAS